ncbi:hypothetical protein [Iningainema tapete]|uniref:Uncharacterized protein n=1 Tax=Iningainema tapete BLCC-T55 TaxID=2748662 RepID=A0A8J6XK94_9CYAN|nr:hypothetical protein [Iningainema tapete]MBD2774131.1 hypothetical protein [Iningainema tapete BLCC-T55]
MKIVVTGVSDVLGRNLLTPFFIVKAAYLILNYFLIVKGVILSFFRGRDVQTFVCTGGRDVPPERLYKYLGY